MPRKSQVTTIGAVTRFVKQPPAVMVLEKGRMPDGTVRSSSQLISVPDQILFSRLLKLVRIGDQVEITVTTEWDECGYRSYLSDFAAVKSAVGVA